jgi:hypothetical protein
MKTLEKRMSVLEEKALEVAEDVPNDGVMAAGDHPFLDWLVENFGKLLPLILACLPAAKRNPTGLQEALNNPNLRMRLGLRFHLQRNMDDPRTGNRNVRDVMDAMLKMGKGCTEAQTTAMIAEVS